MSEAESDQRSGIAAACAVTALLLCANEHGWISRTTGTGAMRLAIVLDFRRRVSGAEYRDDDLIGCASIAAPTRAAVYAPNARSLRAEVALLALLAA
jgi:hypothetical protein